MATEAKKTDLKAKLRGLSEVEQFEHFLKNVAGEKRKSGTPEEWLAVFRDWLVLLDELQVGVDQADAGMTAPFDPEAERRYIRERFAARERVTR